MNFIKLGWKTMNFMKLDPETMILPNHHIPQPEDKKFRVYLYIYIYIYIYIDIDNR